MKRRKEGITLVALVVTIIILLILAGVSIALISNSNGILQKASGAVETNQEATATEKMELKITYLNIVSYGENTRKATLQELAEGLFVDKEIEYVKIKDEKIASLENINVTGENSIFVKLKEYPYEFEINSNLHLASIDGVKLENNGETITIGKEEYESLKPSAIKEDSLLLIAQNSNLSTGVLNLSYFDKVYQNAFESCFSIDETTGDLICQKSGWYGVELFSAMNGPTGGYAETYFQYSINNLYITKTAITTNQAVVAGYDTIFATNFLMKGDKITLVKTTTGSSLSNGNYVSARIIKL